jgi:hypothetical protein
MQRRSQIYGRKLHMIVVSDCAILRMEISKAIHSDYTVTSTDAALVDGTGIAVFFSCNPSI